MKKRDIIIPVFLFLILLFTYQSSHLSISEDAYIMFRYAKNLAEGHGLVWNIGKDPVEGATGFLWTILLAGLYIFKIPFFYSIFILGAVLLLGTAFLIYYFLTRIFRIQPLITAVAAVVILTSPLVIQLRAGFETPLFSFFMTVLTLSSAILIYSIRKFKNVALYALPVGGLFLSLTRPEGIILFFLTVIGTGIMLQSRERKILLHRIVLWFFLPGGFYFLWRWLYFGYLFPNTFYAKSILGSKSILEMLIEGQNTFTWLMMFLSPYILIISLSLLLPLHKKKRILLITVPLLLFPLSYFAIFQAQNVGNRYQIAILPSFLIPFCLSGNILLQKIIKKRFKWIKSLIVFLIGFFLVASSFYQTTHLNWDGGDDDRMIIGKALQPLASKKYTMMSSEAGSLPFYSEWTAIDPAGHYDKYIAHNGLTANYIDEVRPDLIMFHESKGTGRRPYLGGKWDEMIETLHNYAIKQDYILVAVIQKGGVEDAHWYYMKNDISDKGPIIHAIIDHDELVYVYKRQ